MQPLGRSDPELGHGAEPTGNSGGLAEIVRELGGPEAAHALDFDIQDARALQANDLSDSRKVFRRLIQANRRAQSALKLGVFFEGSARQRLLDHQKFEAVELFEDPRILESIRDFFGLSGGP